MPDTVAHFAAHKQDFFHLLRSATGDMHKLLETTPLSVSITDAAITPHSYAVYLAYMQQVIAFCEHEVFPEVTGIFADIELRRKLPLINKDMAFLAAETTVVTPPFFEATLPAGDTPFAAGFMYVTEGSTLGGRMLLQHVSSKLGYNQQNGAAFFAGYGPAAGKYWKDFLQAFGAYATGAGNQQRIIDGSIYAFSAIHKYFSQG